MLSFPKKKISVGTLLFALLSVVVVVVQENVEAFSSSSLSRRFDSTTRLCVLPKPQKSAAPTTIDTSSSSLLLDDNHNHASFLDRVNNNNNNAAAATALAAAASSLVVVTGCPSMAYAATAFTSTAVPGALAAYGHYLSLVGLMGCTMIERLTIKPNMSTEDEKLVAIADIGLGIFGALITYTGYLRLTQYEKGWDFYSHEPLFWLKMGFLAIYGASTFFNTTVIIQRSVKLQQQGTIEPMSEALATRMKKLSNAGIVALALMPLSATLMARGVGYNADIPWQAEAAIDVLLLLGLGYKYIKEALQFDDTDSSSSTSLEI